MLKQSGEFALSTLKMVRSSKKKKKKPFRASSWLVTSHIPVRILHLFPPHIHIFLHFLVRLCSKSFHLKFLPQIYNHLEKNKTTNTLLIRWLCEDERYVLSLAQACSSETKAELLILPACPHSYFHTLFTHTPHTLSSPRYAGHQCGPMSVTQK